MSRGRRIFWMVFAAMAAVYLVMVVWALPKIKTLAGGLDPFDMRPFGYSGDEARAFLSGLEAAGYDFYLNVQQGLDTIFPGLLAVVLVLSFGQLAIGAARWALMLVSALAAGFDYLENAAVRAMLLAGPVTVTDSMVATASRWTMLKSASVTLALTALLVLAVLRWVDFRRRSR